MIDKLPAALWLDLLGKPFVDGARGPAAYDCVGLLVELQHRLGNSIPAWGSHARFLEDAKHQWEKVTDPQPGDGILIFSDDPPWHLGVVAGDGFMIHARPGSGVARERYNAYPWHKRIEGFYRWNPISSRL